MKYVNKNEFGAAVMKTMPLKVILRDKEGYVVKSNMGDISNFEKSCLKKQDPIVKITGSCYFAISCYIFSISHYFVKHFNNICK